MFKTIQDILFTDGHATSDNLENFQPYMVSRYASFYSPEMASYVNDTVNQYGNIFDDKETQYRFFSTVLPTVQRKRIQYASKPKKEVVEDDFPVPEFYSREEFRSLTEEL
jgi:hypothetical protein